MNESTRSRRYSISEGFFPSFRLRTSRNVDYEANEFDEGCNTQHRSKSWSSIIPSFFKKSCAPQNSRTSIGLPQDNSILEKSNTVMDTRQGPLDTDLFWLVLHDLSESR